MQFIISCHNRRPGGLLCLCSRGIKMLLKKKSMQSNSCESNQSAFNWWLNQPPAETLQGSKINSHRPISAVLSASEHLHVQVNGLRYGRAKQLLSSQWLQLLSRGPQSGLRLRRWLIESAPLWRVPTPSQPPYFNGGALNSSFWGIYSPGPIPLQSWRGESHYSLVPTETAAQMHSFRQGGCGTPMCLSVPSLMCVCWLGCRCFCVSVCVCVTIWVSECVDGGGHEIWRFSL